MGVSGLLKAQILPVKECVLWIQWKKKSPNGIIRLYKTLSTYTQKGTKGRQKKSENVRHVKKAKNKIKEMWQLINEEAGKFPSYDQKKWI